jgi:hypothetical protein
MTNCRTGAGNTGHRNITYDEFKLIGELFKALKEEKLRTDVINAVNKSSKKHEKLFKKLGSE